MRSPFGFQRPQSSSASRLTAGAFGSDLEPVLDPAGAIGQGDALAHHLLTSGNGISWDDRVHDRDAQKKCNEDMSDPTIPTIEDKARWISRAIKDFHLIAHRIFRFGVEKLPVRKPRTESLPARMVFDQRRPNPCSARAGIGVDPSREAYNRAASVNPEALDVDTAQQRRKHHHHDCGEKNEVGPGALRHQTYKRGTETCGSMIPKPGRVRSRNDMGV